jgi:hypothetical protein
VTSGPTRPAPIEDFRVQASAPSAQLRRANLPFDCGPGKPRQTEPWFCARSKCPAHECEPNKCTPPVKGSSPAQSLLPVSRSIPQLKSARRASASRAFDRDGVTDTLLIGEEKTSWSSLKCRCARVSPIRNLSFLGLDEDG